MNDLGRALTLPFKDPDWVKKFLPGALFMLLCIVVVGIFILIAAYLYDALYAEQSQEGLTVQ